jgi:undecaprenyl-diphosphatase
MTANGSRRRYVLALSITSVDRHVLKWIVDHRVAVLDPLFVGVTYLGTGGTIWVVAALAVALRTRRRATPVGVFAGLCVWGADAVSNVVKVAVNRPRPYAAMPHLHTLVSRPTSASFPSSHAATAFAGAVVLTFLLPRLWAYFFAAAALVAFSRLYVGVHYPSDVIAGAAIGAAFAGLVVALVERTGLAHSLAPRSR